MTNTHTLIIGASAAGLACAACLKRAGIDYIIVEREAETAHGWRNHYDRLHLHTTKRFSNLPYKSFDASLPSYPSRQDVVNYLDSYRAEMNILPLYNTEITSIKKSDDWWVAESSQGTFRSKYVIIATGQTNRPKLATFKGLDTFPGTVMHSSAYKNGQSFSGKQVLVVGFGNSACEIAIDLHESGTRPSMSVRSAVNVLPRDVLGISILQLSMIMQVFPPRVADQLNAPLIRFLVGDLEKLGLKKSKIGPLEQVATEGRVPLLDIGTIKLLREGHIKAFGDIKSIQGQTVTFEDGRAHDFDAIILATGYSNELEKFVQVDPVRFADLNTSVDHQQYFGKDGLYFCGFYISPSGMLREIGLDAQKIAKDIAAKNR